MECHYALLGRGFSPDVTTITHTRALAPEGATHYNLPMTTKKRHKGPPTGETGQEALYLKSLSDRQVQVAVKMRDGEVVTGWIEYFDDMMVRLTREGKPNLFIYKTQIRSITEGGAVGPKRSVHNDESHKVS
jgi:host factor-I protein